MGTLKYIAGGTFVAIIIYTVLTHGQVATSLATGVGGVINTYVKTLMGN